MKFILTPYSYSVSEEELIDELKKISSLISDEYLSISKYKKLGGKHSEATFAKYFGSWLNALSKAGLRTSRNEKEMKRISDEALINDVIRVAEELKTETITSSQYEELGKVSLWTITNRLGTWDEILHKSGLKSTGHKTNISDIELLNEIERIWIILGKQPTTDDMKKGISKFHLCTFTRRFGGWRKALEEFVKYINGEVIYKEVDNKDIPKVSDVKPSTNNTKYKSRKTPREPSNRLKVQVLMRDGNRCRLCGVECNDGLHNIHFDHIIPWSKGGETVLENLQVLCNDCNLAKGNI
ncbi:MAG: HNH endonuclease [Bacteroidaceae bacterium]|nr:HNH endonuclease [Bacteroidaceae bacterium]